MRGLRRHAIIPHERRHPAQLAPYVTWGAFALAFVFGAVGNKTNFCTMGAVSDWVNMGDSSRMRMWLLAIAAYMTIRGLFGAFRVEVLERASVTLAPGQDLPSLLNAWSGVTKGTWIALLAIGIGSALLALVYASKQVRSTFDYTLGDVVTGLVVVGGWYVSGAIGYVAEDPNTLQEAFVATNTGRMESFSFVAPLAFTLEYLMLWTDKSKIITYGIASAAGVIAGSAVYAIATKTFRLEGFRDTEDTANHIVGGLRPR